LKVNLVYAVEERTVPVIDKSGDMLIAASAEWSFSAEAFAKGGDSDEHIRDIFDASLHKA
jgi:hypothetical protein